MRIQINKKQYEQLLKHINYDNRNIFTPICSWFGDEYKYDDEQEYELVIDDLKAFKKMINLESYKKVEITYGLSISEMKDYILFRDILKQINNKTAKKKEQK
tara:strand:+ start:374 stop:679 length:306 start_codon:yes stop_codon:yes gene_type:complete